MEKNILEIENENNTSAPIQNNAETKPSKPNVKTLQPEENISFPSSFLIEMINFIKNTLFSVNNINLLSIKKFDDVEFRKYARRSITQDIKKIDSMLNTLLNYVNISSPIIKKNTIHLILDDILEANEIKLQDKNIKVFKKYEKDLSETFIHDEQIKFILNSILQYGILSTPSNGSIGFLTRSLHTQKAPIDNKIITLKEIPYIEILIVLTDHKEPFERLDSIQGVPDVKKDATLDLVLRLIKELIQKQQGMIEFKVDEKKSRTLISLRLPVDRRTVILYEHVSL